MLIISVVEEEYWKQGQLKLYQNKILKDIML